MNVPGKTISFTVIYLENEYTVQTYENEYRNLMVLLNDKIYIEDFGQCGGQGRCATCMVEIATAGSSFSPLERNEQATLIKKGGGGENRRLSCQVFINDRLQGAVVKVVYDIY